MREFCPLAAIHRDVGSALQRGSGRLRFRGDSFETDNAPRSDSRPNRATKERRRSRKDGTRVLFAHRRQSAECLKAFASNDAGTYWVHNIFEVNFGLTHPPGPRQGQDASL